MAPRIKASFVFAQGLDSGVVQRLAAVITGVDGNALFPNSPVPPADLKAEGEMFLALMIQSHDGSNKAIAARKNQRELIIAKLRQVASYVEAVSKGNMATFLSSGFEPAASPAAPALSRPGIKKVENGTLGQFLVTVTALRAARHYELSCTPMNGAPGTPSTQILTKTRPAAVVSGLTPGATYGFQVRALGPAGFTDGSDTVIRMAT